MVKTFFFGNVTRQPSPRRLKFVASFSSRISFPISKTPALSEPSLTTAMGITCHSSTILLINSAKLGQTSKGSTGIQVLVYCSQIPISVPTNHRIWRYRGSICRRNRRENLCEGYSRGNAVFYVNFPSCFYKPKTFLCFSVTIFFKFNSINFVSNRFRQEST